MRARTHKFFPSSRTMLLVQVGPSDLLAPSRCEGISSCGFCGREVKGDGQSVSHPFGSFVELLSPPNLLGLFVVPPPNSPPALRKAFCASPRLSESSASMSILQGAPWTLVRRRYPLPLPNGFWSQSLFLNLQCCACGILRGTK